MSGSSITRKILSEAENAPPELGVPGFIAMQCYAGTLNRTFVIFICFDGLYGSKFRGPASNLVPGFFRPMQGMLADPANGFLLDTVRRLAGVRGGFLFPRAEIAFVGFNHNSKWGTGGIPHSGRIEIKRTSGTTCEFVLLGHVNGREIRETVLDGGK